jgi:hypothetical protein
MSDQRLLDDLGKMLDPPGDHAPAHVRQRVMAGLTDGRAGRSPRLTAMGRTAVGGGLVALVVVGVSIVSTLQLGSHRPAASAEAAEILNRAASTAKQAPTDVPRPEQFIFIESRLWYPAPGSRSGTGLTRSWHSVDGTRDGLVWTELPGRDGQSQTVVPGCRDGHAPEWGEDGTLRQDKTRACQPDPAYLPDLPVTPKSVLSYLTTTASPDGSGETRAFVNAGTLLQTRYLAPQSRAAVFEAVALIPDVTALHDVTDAAGRPGIAVVSTVRGLRHEMLFDPQTYQFLGWQLEPDTGGSESALQARREAVLRIAVVDAPGQLP